MTQPDATLLIGGLIGLIIIGLGLTTAGYVFGKAWLLIAAAIGWLGLTFLGFLERGDWNMGNLFIWLGIGLGLVCMMSAIWMAYKARPEPEAVVPPDEQYEQDLENIRQAEMSRKAKRMGNYTDTHEEKPYGSK